MSRRKRQRTNGENGDNEPATKRQRKQKNEPKPLLRERWLSRSNCRPVSVFDIEGVLGEGSYGTVFKAKNKQNKQVVALKQLKAKFSEEQFDGITIREVNTCLQSKHEHVVRIQEIVFGPSEIYLAMEFMKGDLSDLIAKKREQAVDFSACEVRTLMRQLVSATAHMHKNNIIHRDLKPSNLLVSARGNMKVADFGFAREHDGRSPEPLTPGIVTICYRAIELLLAIRNYSFPIDMWSIGCIFAELLLKKRLFPGRSEIEMIENIFEVLGTPDENEWPEFKEFIEKKQCEFRVYPAPTFRDDIEPKTTAAGFDLISKLFLFNPSKRISAEEALSHSFFQTE